MRWIEKQGDPKAAQMLVRALGLHPVAAGLLAQRGVKDAAAAERFLSPRLAELPDPFTMKGMERAVERLNRAVLSGEAVTVYGDYDVDGVTSTSLLVEFLGQVGAKVGYYVPHRLQEGYGLNPAAVDRIAESGTRLIVTVDCGVTAHEEVERATRAGVEVLIVDHHKTPPELPKAVAMLNPHQPGCAFVGKEMSAVGVTFFLVMALRKRLRELGHFEKRPEPNLKHSLDLVALGTVADVVPLVNVNRILVHHGLEQLEHTRRPGLVALKRVAKVEGRMTAGQVGFKLGPHINAAGRLDDAGAAVSLLLGTDREECERLAERLGAANEERREIERQVTEAAVQEAWERVDKVKGLVVSGEGWHPGVVGIVASRLVERFHRPTVVIGLEGETGKGSCRSIEAFDMYSSLGRCASELVRFGGHHHAAGVTVERSRLGAFRAAFEAEAARLLTEKDLEPVLKIDARISPAEATLELAAALSRLGPFGAGHPEPVFLTELSSVESRILPAKSGPGDHLKFRIGPADAIAFGLGERLGVLRGHSKVAFQLQVDEWQGRQKASAKVKAIEERR